MTTTAFSAPASNPATRRTVDAPTRVMHLLMALSFLGAYVTADGERWRLLHATLGDTLMGLLAFRVVWGMVGPRHARPSVLWRKLHGPQGWLSGLMAGAPNWRLAQNLLLTFSVVILLALIAPLTLSDYGAYNEWTGEWIEGVREFFGNALLAVVLAHITLITGLSVLRRKNQMTPMLTGRVEGAGPDLPKSNHSTVATLLLAAVPQGGGLEQDRVFDVRRDHKHDNRRHD